MKYYLVFIKANFRLVPVNWLKKLENLKPLWFVSPDLSKPLLFIYVLKNTYKNSILNIPFFRIVLMIL